MIVVIDGFAKGAEAQVYEADLAPRVIRVILIAQYFRILLQRSAVLVFEFLPGPGFLIGIRRAGQNNLQLICLSHGFLGLRQCLGRRLLRLDLDWRGRNLILRTISAAAAGDW